MTVSLPPELQKVVAEKVASGAYRSESEVITHAVRLLKERDEIRQRRIEELRKEITIGLEQADRGEVAPLDVESIKAEGRKQLEQRSKQH